MPAFTTNQWAILFLVLLLGWLLGLVSRSGGAKWRRTYEAERDARAADLAQRDATIAAANTRIAELEKSRDATDTAIAKTPDAARDDLSQIRGVGVEGAPMLYDRGFHTYAQIARLTTHDEHKLEDDLGADRGYIAQEGWREQADLLAAGKTDEHRRRFG